MVSVEITQSLTGLIVQLGIGGSAGFLAGYALKKLAKVLAVISGAFILVLMYLNYQGVIMMNWEKLLGDSEKITEWLGGQYPAFSQFIITNIPFAGSFTAGLTLGFKKS